MTSPHNANPLPANNNQAARKNNVEGVKVLLTTLSLTATIGLWQLFASSNQAKPVEKPQAAPPQSVQIVGMPTLVPIVGHQAPLTGQQAAAAAAAPAPVLREVGNPAPRPAVQRPRPAIEVIMSAPANNPVTNTGSSR